jgi:hypothetical protein
MKKWNIATLAVLIALTTACTFGQEFLNMPTQKKPLNGASWPDTNHVVLDWVVAYGPNIYVYWELAEGDSGFLVQSGYVGWVTTTMVYHLQFGHTYYWRLKFKQSVHPFFTSPWTGWWKFTVDRPLSVQSRTSESGEMSAYPNPFTASTTVRYFTPQAERVSIEVTNILGQRIMAMNNESSPGWNNVVLRPSLRAIGTYYCIVRSEGSTKVIPLVYGRAATFSR